MTIAISIIKIIISVVIGYIIFKNFEIKDTSRIQAIALSKRGIVNKIFSHKQLNNIEICFNKLNIPYNTLSVLSLIVIGGIISIVVFVVSTYFFALKSICLIIAFPFVLTPFWLIKYITKREQDKLEAGLNDFFIQLKSALKINSDVIEALRRIQNICLEPFSSYIKQLLREINAGKLPELALEGFANKVGIKKFTFYINNVRYCNIYGGDITTLTEKTQDTLAQALKQKRKRIKETKSICIVLYILVIIDIYMYFSFIEGNTYYLNTMTNSFLGRSILNINFISIWGIVWLSKVVKKFDY